MTCENCEREHCGDFNMCDDCLTRMATDLMVSIDDPIMEFLKVERESFTAQNIRELTYA